MNWDKIKKYHLNPPSEKNTLRSDDVQDQYEKHKQEIKNSGLTLSDYMFTLLFKDSQDWVIKKNDFPYDLESNICHLVLWIHPTQKYTDKEINQIIDTYSAEQNAKEYVYYQNVPQVRSVDGIDHFQLFLLT